MILPEWEKLEKNIISLKIEIEKAVTRMYKAGLRDFGNDYPMLVPERGCIYVNGIRMSNGGTLLLKEKESNRCHVLIHANIDGLLYMMAGLGEESHPIKEMDADK